MIRKICCSIVLLLIAQFSNAQVLVADSFKQYVNFFNTMEDEPIVQAVPNNESWNWFKGNIPLFESPDTSFDEIYYFRWWTLRKHIKETPKGYVFTEFLINRSYADQFNLISSALGHHVYEARWLHDQKYLNDYLRVWFRGNEGKPMKKLRFYSGWNEDAIYNRFLVNYDKSFLLDLYPDMVEDYKGWKSDHKSKNGLFWQYDVRDAMEETISGGRKERNNRPSINGYMYGNANALSHVAALNENKEDETFFLQQSDSLKAKVRKLLWNPNVDFFEVLKDKGDTLSNVMEEIGFIPWYFNLPDNNHSSAWGKLMDTAHFNAPAGITTADRSDARFRSHGCCKCEWDGAIWPFATSQTLTAMANVLNNYKQKDITKKDYFTQIEKYATSQHRNGKPYIGEYMDEKTGQWLTDDVRGRDYNHSTFNDLVITGLAGLRPRADNIVEVNPLLPDGKWDWFALDNVLYHGKILTIIWDKSGNKYHHGKGLSVWMDGKRIAHAKKLVRVTGKL